MDYLGERYLTGVTALLAGGSSASVAVVSLSDLDVEATNLAPSTATATYSLLASGDVTAFALPDGVWIFPRSGMASYEVRASVTFGTIGGAATGSWLSLASSRTWSNSRSTVGITTGGMTVEIRRAGGDGTVLASASITLTATVS